MLRRGQRKPRPQLQARPRPAHRSPGDGAAAGQAPQKVARSQGSGRSHLRLSSSRWSSQPSPGSVPARCPLCHAVPPHQHRWGRCPDKGEQISPSPLFPHQHLATTAPHPHITWAPLPSPRGPSPTQLGCPAIIPSPSLPRASNRAQGPHPEPT